MCLFTKKNENFSFNFVNSPLKCGSWNQFTRTMTVLDNSACSRWQHWCFLPHCLPRLDTLLNVRQVVLHLLRCKSAESIAVADPNLYVVLRHLTLEALLEGENSSVHSILELQVLGVPLLQKRLARLIPSTDQERDSKGPHPTRLGVLLHNQRHPVNQLRRGDGLVVHEVVVLCHFPGPADEKSVVRAHPAVHHPDIASDLLNLVG